jgi:hypothetical protein
MANTLTRAELQTSLRQRLGIDLAIQEKPAPELLATCLPGIDIPRGTMTEISGPPTSGRASIVNALLAQVTRRPEFCALIDGSNSFDPLSAANAGVQLRHLLWVRCGGSAEKALKAADLVVQAGGFGVVAFDLAGVRARDTRRISLASWFRLRHAVENTPTALVLIGDERHAASCSMLQLETRTVGFQIEENLLHGVTIDTAIGPRLRVRWLPMKSVSFSPWKTHRRTDARCGSRYQ